MREVGDIYVGVGGWRYEPWRSTFYPPELPRRSELEFISRKLTSIEINGTFYRTQSRSTFVKWRDATPEGFMFSFKAPRNATLRKTPNEGQESIARFFNSGVAKARPRAVTVPPQKSSTRRFFDAFFALMPRQAEGERVRHAIERREFCLR